MPENEQVNPEMHDATMMPISDAWWANLLRVFNGNPPHPREYYLMPACPDWGPKSVTRFDPKESDDSKEERY